MVRAASLWCNVIRSDSIKLHYYLCLRLSSPSGDSSSNGRLCVLAFGVAQVNMCSIVIDDLLIGLYVHNLVFMLFVSMNGFACFNILMFYHVQDWKLI